MTAGKSRFAMIKEKNNVMNDIIDIAREETNKEGLITSNQEKNAALQLDMGSKDVEEKPAAPESVASEKSINTLDYDARMNEFVNTFVKKIQESGDPRILKKHPQYKGVRYKRSYLYEEHLYDWMLEVNKEKGVDITFMVNEAVREYLQREYPDCEPKPKA